MSEPTLDKSVIRKHKAVARVVEEILRSPRGPADVSSIAEKLGFSRFHLSRQFHGVTGEPLCDFVRRIRLERAAYAFQNSDLTVKEVSFECGYESPEAFSRAFRTAFGCLPTAFRQSNADWLLDSQHGLHWSPDWVEKRVGEKWGDSLVNCGPRHCCVWRVVRSYMELFASWEMLREQFSSSIPESAIFVTLYLDNMWTHPVTETMRADIGWLCESTDQAPEGMRITTIPAGMYAVSQFVPRGQRKDLWSYMVARYGSNRPRRGLKFYDEYDRLPIPFCEAQTRALVGVSTP